jgi:hypothetical protein
MPDTPRLVNLSVLYFKVTRAVDNGRGATVEEAHDALKAGRAMEFLDQYDEIQLDSYKDPNSRSDWDEMNAMFERYTVFEPQELGVDNNGLLFILAQIVELIQSDWWTHPDAPGEIDLRDAEIKRDW